MSLPPDSSRLTTYLRPRILYLQDFIDEYVICGCNHSIADNRGVGSLLALQSWERGSAASCSNHGEVPLERDRTVVTTMDPVQWMNYCRKICPWTVSWVTPFPEFGTNRESETSLLLCHLMIMTEPKSAWALGDLRLALYRVQAQIGETLVSQVDKMINKWDELTRGGNGVNHFQRNTKANRVLIRTGRCTPFPKPVSTFQKAFARFCRRTIKTRRPSPSQSRGLTLAEVTQQPANTRVIADADSVSEPELKVVPSIQHCQGEESQSYNEISVGRGKPRSTFCEADPMEGKPNTVICPTDLPDLRLTFEDFGREVDTMEGAPDALIYPLDLPDLPLTFEDFGREVDTMEGNLDALICPMDMPDLPLTFEDLGDIETPLSWDPVPPMADMFSLESPVVAGWAPNLQSASQSYLTLQHFHQQTPANEPRMLNDGISQTEIAPQFGAEQNSTYCPEEPKPNGPLHDLNLSSAPTPRSHCQFPPSQIHSKIERYVSKHLQRMTREQLAEVAKAWISAKELHERTFSMRLGLPGVSRTSGPSVTRNSLVRLLCRLLWSTRSPTLWSINSLRRSTRGLQDQLPRKVLGNLENIYQKCEAYCKYISGQMGKFFPFSLFSQSRWLSALDGNMVVYLIDN